MLRRTAAVLKRGVRHSLTRYLALAGLGFAVDVGLLALLHRFTPLPSAAVVSIAFWLTYALNFVLNRRLAFHAERGPIGRQLVRFLPQVLLDFVLTLSAVLAFQALGLALPVARIVAAGANLTLNYVLYRWWTFRGTRKTSPEVHPRPSFTAHHAEPLPHSEPAARR
ncbi:GtrA family protein [Actinoplanes sp. NPDC049265]|uniref:GtrA family protein n=1 Tax=Actinoplanes sp. NPDC049265 TaxID=3363902 RepID=UPI00371FDB08